MFRIVGLAVWGVFFFLGWRQHRPVICVVSGLFLLLAVFRWYGARMRERSARRLWDAFAKGHGALAGYPYRRWIFQNRPGSGEHIGGMILSGRIRGESYPVPYFEANRQPLPEIGQYNVVCDGEKRAVCVVRTISVVKCAFSEVSQELAGIEGYSTPEKWRDARRQKFEQLCEISNVSFGDRLEVLFEEFEIVYPPKPA